MTRLLMVGCSDVAVFGITAAADALTVPVVR